MVVSIGCGDGYIEGLLQQKCDIQMLGMDLYQTEDDFESYLNTTVYLPSILRVKRGELLNLNHYRTECSVAEENVALLFCFGRRLPWQAYLDAFPWVRHVFIIADMADSQGNSIAQPECDALRDNPEWQFVAALPIRAAMVVHASYYRRATRVCK